MKVRIKQENLDDLSKKGIYRIFSKETNKSYVGSTWKSFRSRWKQHLSKLNTNNHHSKELQNAFNKYGTDAFICEILEIVSNSEILLEREAYYIEKYDSYHNGYNENPNPSKSPMENESSRIKSSATHKEWWEQKKEELSPEEYEQFIKEYSEKRGYYKGKEPWNKGKKMTEEQTKNMHKPKTHGVTQAMKDVHIKNAQRNKNRADYVIVYDLNKKWLNTFWCNSDLVEYSKSEFNDLPIKARKGVSRTLDPSKIANHIKDGTPYKGLYLRRAPKGWKLPCANAANSWKAEAEPIMSQAEGTPSEGAETSGEV